MSDFSILDAARQALHDPSTTPADLSAIAQAQPTLWTEIARHPGTYPGLLDWLTTYGDEGVARAVAERRARDAAPPVASAPAVPSQPAAAAAGTRTVPEHALTEPMPDEPIDATPPEHADLSEADQMTHLVVPAAPSPVAAPVSAQPPRAAMPEAPAPAFAAAPAYGSPTPEYAPGAPAAQPAVAPPWAAQAAASPAPQSSFAPPGAAPFAPGVPAGGGVPPATPPQASGYYGAAPGRVPPMPTRTAPGSAATNPATGSRRLAFRPASPVPLIAGLLVAIAGAASIALYMWYDQQGPHTGSSLGSLPGFWTLASTGHAMYDYYFTVNAIVCGAAWIGLGLLIILGAKHHLVAVGVTAAVLVGLLFLIPGIEIILVSMPPVWNLDLLRLVALAVLSPLALVVAMIMVAVAGARVGRGQGVGGLKSIAIILIALVLAVDIGTAVYTLVTGGGPVYNSTMSGLLWLLGSPLLEVGLLLLAIGIVPSVECPDAAPPAPAPSLQTAFAALPYGQPQVPGAAPQQWRP